MAFSSAIVLGDLDDYISPSQACIKPVEVIKTETSQDPQAIKVDDQGTYYEITKDGGESKLETASITLNDCLACSGCVTSAESVLITMQSQQELYSILEANKQAIERQDPTSYRTIVISISPQTRASLAAKYNLTPLQVHRRLVTFFKHRLGVHHVFDSSFSRDFSLVESAREFVERFRNYLANGGEEMEAKLQQSQADADTEGQPRSKRRREPARAHTAKSDEAKYLPMLASSCPGWICYAEKTHGDILPFVSTTKSPQQVMGVLVKEYFATKINVTPDRLYHVSVMPCFDKKLEASRPDFFIDQYNTRQVDCVLTTGEIEHMFNEQGVDFVALHESPIDDMFNKVSTDQVSQEQQILGTAGSSSGGALEYIMATAARELFGITDVPDDPEASPSPRVVMHVRKNADMREYTLKADDGRSLLRFATAYGFRNIQNLVRKIKSGKCHYHYVEVMACPGGCANGGGQARPPTTSKEDVVSAKDWLSHVETIYRSVSGVKPEDNEQVKAVYADWIGQDTTGQRAAQLLRTQYHAVTQDFGNPLATKW